ncbi:Tripartite motif-containing protein 2-like [Oopsacas minuta]|uniref:Tripartite motif-containing protein 2-like n=1 Tax=Oopsacas minuta TaxID=111878 RepID=A0AAV7JSI7_9METZ|nr:Tripartite motif-containing protein 2-like [Oopsacas minuta]
MAENGNEEQISLEEVKQLVCCLNCHSDPNTKLLACYHALCDKCINLFLQKNSIHCPVCFNATPIPNTGISKLFNNSLGEDLYQITKCEMDFSNDIICTNCIVTPPNSAGHFCQQCKKYFCNADIQTHQLLSDQSEHNIISRGDTLSISYCEDQHDGMKQSIGEMQSRASALSNLMQEFEFQIENVDSEEQKLKSEIREKYQELREKINLREKYLSEILSNHYDIRRKEIEKASENVAAILLKLYHNINFASKAVEISPRDILARINEKLNEQIRCTLESSVTADDIILPEAEPLVFKVDDDVMNELVNFGSIGINRNYFTIDQPTMLFANKGKHIAAGIAIDDENGILIVNQGTKSIDVFSTEGGYIKSWGKERKSDGDFQMPHAICCRDNRVLVTDLVKCNVQVFSLSGKFISKFGSKDTMRCPIGLDMWKDGYVFVVDQVKRWIIVYTPEFEFGWLLGEGKITKPVDLKVAQWADVFFVLDDGIKGVLGFSRDGEVIRKFDIDNIKLKEPFSLALDTIGHILVSDVQEKELRVFNWAGKRSEAICPSFGTPKGIAVDRKGRVVMVEDHEDKLQLLIF